MKIKIAIYARISTGKQDYDNQIDQLKDYCKKQEWDVEHIYKEVISGKESERPEFKRMLEDAHKRKFDAILVWALDRFTREGVERVFHYLTQLNALKVKFISYQEPYFNTDNEMVRGILLSVMGALAKQERIRISERTKAGLQRAVKRGQKLGRPELKSTDNRIIELHKQGKKMREITELVHYWDKARHKKFVSIGYVHKVISNFRDVHLTQPIQTEELNRQEASEELSLKSQNE